MRTSGVGMRMAILGRFEVRDDSGRLELGPYKQRIVLTLLLCNANRVVSVRALSEALRDDEPPRTARKNLQVYISTPRRTLRLGAGGADVRAGSLVHRAPGYVLHVAEDRVDSLTFHELAGAGRLAARGGDVAGAAGKLGQALALWRGAVLAELHAVPTIAAEAAKPADAYTWPPTRTGRRRNWRSGGTPTSWRASRNPCAVIRFARGCGMPGCSRSTVPGGAG
jgi:Bacterial transcriptional activator domain